MNPVIVLGMHRSGTSAMARLVNELGVNVGTNLLPATESNVHGHFEEAAFIRFHDALIARCFPKRAPFCEWLPLTNTEVVYTDADRIEARAIWNAHCTSGSNAWKDPRTSLFVDLWLEVLAHAKVIVCLRHPYQVHLSFLRRGEPFLHVDYSAAILGWNVYNQKILKVINSLPQDRFMVVDVDAAFRDPRQLTEGLAHFLGVQITSKAFDAVAPEAFHFEDDAREALGHFGDFLSEAEATYRQLKQFDFLNRIALNVAPISSQIPIGLEEARLIEFEETHGLRPKAKKMLVRSIAVDRQRLTALYQQAVNIGLEKDRLIEDLSRLNDCLKRRITDVERPSDCLVTSR